MRTLLLVLGIVLSTHAVGAPTEGLRSLSRAEAVRMLLLNRTDHVPLFPNKGRFPDVPSGHYDERYLLAAERYGIMSADPTTRMLRPDALVTRAEFMKMLTLTFGLSDGLAVRYVDVRPEDWYFSYAGLSQIYGILPSDGFFFGPNIAVTHDDAVFAIATIRQLLEASATEEEQEVAKEQAEHHLEMYVVISSKQLKTVFDKPEGEFSPHLAATADAKLEELRQDVLNLVNEERAKVGSPPLMFNTLLNDSSQQYAERMADEGFFSHVTPTGETLKDRIRDSGYYDRSYSEDCRCVKGYALAENLARGQRTPKEAVDAWMRSPSHKEALLSPDYEDTGIGISSGLWVQHFGGVLEPTEMVQNP